MKSNQEDAEKSIQLVYDAFLKQAAQEASNKMGGQPPAAEMKKIQDELKKIEKEKEKEKEEEKEKDEEAKLKEEAVEHNQPSFGTMAYFILHYIRNKTPEQITYTFETYTPNPLSINQVAQAASHLGLTEISDELTKLETLHPTLNNNTAKVTIKQDAPPYHEPDAGTRHQLQINEQNCQSLCTSFAKSHDLQINTNSENGQIEMSRSSEPSVFFSVDPKTQDITFDCSSKESREMAADFVGKTSPKQEIEITSAAKNKDALQESFNPSGKNNVTFKDSAKPQLEPVAQEKTPQPEPEPSPDQETKKSSTPTLKR